MIKMSQIKTHEESTRVKKQNRDRRKLSNEDARKSYDMTADQKWGYQVMVGVAMVIESKVGTALLWH